MTGALTLATGLDCVVVLLAAGAPWGGSSVLAISLPSAVMGTAMETGRAWRGARGSVVLAAVVAAPADPMPVNSAAASTNPPPIAPHDVRLIRFTVLLPSIDSGNRCRMKWNGPQAASCGISGQFFPGIFSPYGMKLGLQPGVLL